MENNSRPIIIFLVGMPGVGKSYWAKKCAEFYGLQYLDTDDLIEQIEQKSVSDIFKIHGEQYFRNKETEILETINKKNTTDIIVSCGGGTPCFNDNMILLNEIGTTVYLKSGIDLLVSNLLADSNQRPLLSNSDELLLCLEKLLLVRSRYYELAKYILQAEEIDLTKFEKIINSCTNQLY